MIPQDLIIRKRDGGELSPEQIEFFVRETVSGGFADYQTSALLMAIVLRGMTTAETAALTRSMLLSGDVVDLGDMPGIKVDKHSTGGVGDKVSLILAPLVAACGVPVPMMSGRGLGHTGGTLDKLESIPGFRTNLSIEEYRNQVARLGVAMIGQSERLVPADRKLYALRDVTGTVESIPLISASIMSKKQAEGIDALVLDVKFGRGAFMPTLERARELAESMIGIGRASGMPVRALLTAMEEPLGHSVGNAVEVQETIECLRGRGPADLMAVTSALAIEMLLLGRRAETPGEARRLVDDALGSGRALERFQALVEAQGGPRWLIDSPERLPAAPVKQAVRLSAGPAGFVVGVDARELGVAVLCLGGGRTRTDGIVDPSVGITSLVKVGTELRAGDLLGVVHAREEAQADRAAAVLKRAVVVGDRPSGGGDLVRERLGG